MGENFEHFGCALYTLACNCMMTRSLKDQERILIRQFIRGILDEEIAQAVKDLAPRTLCDAIVKANQVKGQWQIYSPHDSPIRTLEDS